MARCLLVYFSQGGSTARLADAFASGLAEAGYHADLHNLYRNSSPPSPSDYDLLGVGSPVYYYRLPFNVSDYVRRLPNLRGVPVFSFIVWATYHREAGDYLSRSLRARGGTEVGRFKSKGAGTFLSYAKEGYRFSAEHPTQNDLDAAHAFGRLMAERVSRGQREDVWPASEARPIDRFERFVTNRWLVRQFYSRFFSVDSRRCKGCGHCEQTCPTGNITVEKRGSPTWGRDCLLCLACEAECPNDAITSPLSWPLFRPFMMYNVYHASMDPSLTHVHVSHSHGRTRVV